MIRREGNSRFLIPEYRMPCSKSVDAWWNMGDLESALCVADGKIRISRDENPALHEPMLVAFNLHNAADFRREGGRLDGAFLPLGKFKKRNAAFRQHFPSSDAMKDRIVHVNLE